MSEPQLLSQGERGQVALLFLTLRVSKTIGFEVVLTLTPQLGFMGRAFQAARRAVTAQVPVQSRVQPAQGLRR